MCRLTHHRIGYLLVFREEHGLVRINPDKRITLCYHRWVIMSELADLCIADDVKVQI